MTSCTKPCIIALPSVRDDRGKITFIEEFRNIPFTIGKVNWQQKSDTIDGEALVIALSGSAEITSGNDAFVLDNNSRGLYIPPYFSCKVSEKSKDTTFLILRPEKFESDKGLIPTVGTQFVPFDIKRIYYISDVPAGKIRGNHAHKSLAQLLVAINGSLEVTLDDSTSKHTYTLDSPNKTIYIEPGMWRTVEKFSPEAICLVVSSELYDEADYIRDYDRYISGKY